MSGKLDAKAGTTALKLLQKFGKKVTYKKTTPGTYDPNTQTISNTTADYAITIYLESTDVGLISGGLAVSTDMVALVAARELPVEVKASDTMLIDGKLYTVKLNTPVYSGELIALHQILIQAM